MCGVCMRVCMCVCVRVCACVYVWARASVCHLNYLYSPFRNRPFCNNCNIQHLTVYSIMIICIYL